MNISSIGLSIKEQERVQPSFSWTAWADEVAWASACLIREKSLENFERPCQGQALVDDGLERLSLTSERGLRSILIADLHLQIKHVVARSPFPNILNLHGHQHSKKSPRKTSTEEDSSLRQRHSLSEQKWMTRWLFFPILVQLSQGRSPVFIILQIRNIIMLNYWNIYIPIIPTET